MPPLLCLMSKNDDILNLEMKLKVDNCAMVIKTKPTESINIDNIRIGFEIMLFW